jgi:hypothetical protein
VLNYRNKDGSFVNQVMNASIRCCWVHMAIVMHVIYRIPRAKL